MAKTIRKTETPATGPKTRKVRRKAAAQASTDTPAPKAAKTAKTATTARTPTVAPVTPAIAPRHHEIAERAYHIYLRRDGRPGNPDHDWQQAIEELRAERG